MPNYVKLWMNESIDKEIEGISERMETLIDELSNTRSMQLLSLLNNYPIISVRAHVRPFENYWLNLLCGVILPIGIFFYFRIWIFRMRLEKDMMKIIKTNEEVCGVMKSMKK